MNQQRSSCCLPLLWTLRPFFLQNYFIPPESSPLFFCQELYISITFLFFFTASIFVLWQSECVALGKLFVEGLL